MIHPEFKPLSEIWNNKLFRIPEYQRHYSWQPKQRKELFDDIKKLEKAKEKHNDRIHFMATIVCLKTQESVTVAADKFYIYEVVDGQQRLTTLIILLKAISLRLKSENQSNAADKLDQILVKDGHTHIILQNNHDSSFILSTYLISGGKPAPGSIKTTADSNIAQAIKDCENFVNSYSDAINLLSLVKNDLYFIFQSLEDKGAVYTIFEVLNSRGLDVDWLDKCKSLLMGLLYEYASDPDNTAFFTMQLKELHKYWSEIYKEIGLQDIPGHEIIRFAATLKKDSKAGRPLSAEDTLEFFKADCTSIPSKDDVIKKIFENTVWLKEITFCLSKLYADKRRKAVTDITQARLLAVAIMLRKSLTEQERDKLLEQWERTSFRIFGLFRKDARTKVGEYVYAAKKIQNDSSANFNDLLKSISEIGDDFPIEQAVEELRKSNFYHGWQQELRYFFFRYEEHLLTKNGSHLKDSIWHEIWAANPNNTIEHILPQVKSEPGWEHISDSKHKELVHSIGNLSLLSPPLQKEASNKCFAHKKIVYNKANLELFKNIISNNGVERSEWNEDAINDRTEQLIKFAMEQWKDL